MVVRGGRSVCSQVTEASLWQGGRNVRAESGLKLKLPKEQEKASENLAAVGWLGALLFGMFFFSFSFLWGCLAAKSCFGCVV